MKRIFTIIVLNVVFSVAHSQARLVINSGGIINISNNAMLVIDNPAPNAITRIGSGHIISEGENNRLRWNIGTTAGSYVIPFGTGTTTYLPLSISTSGAVGAGHFIFSTYGTPTWQNTLYMPSGITHMNSDIDGTDNSNHVTDRFYQLNAVGYTTKPTATNLQFSYLDTEHSVASNNIVESFLQAQRWNPTLEDWNDLTPIGNTNTVTNRVDVLTVTPANLYGWWVLVDNQFPLPIALTWFKTTCEQGKNVVTWETASELNNDYFVVERSIDGVHFVEAGQVESQNGSSNTAQQYQYIDADAPEDISYYRLKQIDYNGHYTYSSIVRHTCIGTSTSIVKVYPNPSSQYVVLDIKELTGDKTVTWYNTQGQEVIQSELLDQGATTTKQYDISHLPQGTYLLQLKLNDQIHQVFKVIKE